MKVTVKNKTYKVVSRGYRNWEEAEKDVPRKFRRRGSTTYYDKKTEKWYVIAPE